MRHILQHLLLTRHFVSSKQSQLDEELQTAPQRNTGKLYSIRPCYLSSLSDYSLL